MESGSRGGNEDEAESRAEDQVAEARRILPAAADLRQADSLDDEFREVALKRHKSDTTLAGAMGWSTLALFVAQALIVDAGFLTYAAEKDWHMPEGVVIAWLGAGVVQVIGSVALVVARYLFPDGGLMGTPNKHA